MIYNQNTIKLHLLLKCRRNMELHKHTDYATHVQFLLNNYVCS